MMSYILVYLAVSTLFLLLYAMGCMTTACMIYSGGQGWSQEVKIVLILLSWAAVLGLSLWWLLQLVFALIKGVDKLDYL
jgi:hypothetical protein